MTCYNEYRLREIGELLAIPGLSEDDKIKLEKERMVLLDEMLGEDYKY